MLTRIARISFYNGLEKHVKVNRSKTLSKTIYRRMLWNSVEAMEADRSKTGMSGNSTYIKNVYQGLDDRCLKVAWSDGTASRFPFNFLRDNCKCPECFESSSRQKLFNTARDLIMDIQAKEAVVSEDGQSLKCVWPGGHESKYSLNWLYKMRMPEENEYRQQNSDSLVKDELILWNREVMQDKIPFYDYNALMSEDESLFDFLYGLYQRGLIVIDKAPARDGVLLELSARIGYHKRTHYGETFDVKDVENPSNLAYTNRGLPLHIDLPFLRSVPSIQLLHCIHENTSGGDSIFVDGFNVAKQIQKNHPDAFNILKEFHVRYVDYGADAFGEFAFGYSYPIIKLNRHGRIIGCLYNGHVECESKADCTPDELLAFYDALYVLTKGLQDPNNATTIHLKSGQIAVFHNTRVLHGRTEFKTAAGEPMARWLQGIYFDWDVIFSKLRVLQNRLSLKSPYIPDHSDDCF